MNNSYENMQKYRFDQSLRSKSKQNLGESKENKFVRVRRNLNENIEPDRIDKFVNIKSTENFIPGRVKAESIRDSGTKWSFWNTLKNPLQWFGASNDSQSNTPIKDSSNQEKPVFDSLRNRSISYNVYDNSKGWVVDNKSLPADRTMKYPKSNEKTNYANFSKSFKRTDRREKKPKKVDSRSFKYSHHQISN